MALGLSDIAQSVVLNTKYDNAGTKALHKDLDDTADKGSKVGSALGAIGKGLAIAGTVGAVGVVAGLAGAVKTAADFEQSLNNVAAATNATDDELKQLRASALETGKVTALSASAAVEAYGELAKAGLSVKDIVGGAGRATVDLAVSQNKSVQDMAALMSASLNTFGLGADKATDVANILGRAAGASTIDVHDLSDAIQNGGATAKIAGLSLDEFSTAVALMGSHGVSGAEAGTQLKTMLLALEAPGAKAEGALRDIGVSMYDAEGKTRKARDVFFDLQQAFAKMTDEERNRANKDIFGSYGINASNVLLLQEGKDGWDKFTEATARLPTVADQAATRMKGLKGNIEQLKGSVETLAIGIGSKVLPSLTSLAAGATGVVNKLIEGDWKGAGRAILSGIGDAFQGGLDISRQVGGWLGDQIGKIDWGQVWGFVRDLPQRIGDGLTKGLDIVEQLTGWLGDQIAGINWDEVWSKVKTGAIQIFGPDAGKVVDGIRDTLKDLGKVLDTEVLPRLDDFRTALSTDIGPGFLSAAKDAIGWLGDHPDVLEGAAIGVGALAVAWGAYNVAAGIAAFLTGTILTPVVLITAAAALLGVGITELVLHWQDLQGAFPPLKQFSDWFGNSFVPGLTTGFTTISTAIQSVVSWVQEHWAGISDLLSGPFQILFAIVQGQFNLIKDEIQLAFDVITGIAKIFGDVFRGDWSQLWTDIKGLASNVFSDIGRLIGDQISAWVGIFGGVWTTIKAASSQAWGEIGESVTGALHGVWQWIQDHWVDVVGTLLLSPIFLFRDQIGDGIEAAAGKVTDGLHGIWQWLQDNWVDVLGVALFGPFYLFRDQIGGVMRAAGNALLDPLRGVIGGFNSFLGAVKDAINWVPEQLHLGALITGSLSVPNIPQLAMGTADWPGGMAWVGEKGAELAYLPAGSTVIPHEESVALAKRHGLPFPGFQVGLGDLGDIAGGLFDKVGDLAGSALDFAKEWIAKGADKLLEEAFHRFGVELKLPGAFADLAPAIVGHIKDAALAAIKDVLGLSGKHVPATFQGAALNLPGTVTEWLQAAAQLALSRALSADELAAQLYLVSRESGGDPNSVNPTAVIGSDGVNYGHAAGLLQIIPGTFATWAVPGHGNVLNPIDNAAASFRYQLGVYHSLLLAAQREAGGAPGYGTGGVAGLHGPELAWLGEYGPERVTPLAGGTGDFAGLGTETQALGYYLAEQVTLLTSLQTLGLSANANALALLDAVRGQGAASVSQSSAQVKSTDATTAAVTATGAKTAATIAAVVTPGGLTNTADLRELGQAARELIPIITGGGGLAPAFRATTDAASAAAGGLRGLADDSAYAAFGTQFLGNDLREASSATRAATQASDLLSGYLADAQAKTGDLAGEFVSTKHAVAGLADAAKGAAQQLDTVGTPGTAPNPYAPSTTPPPAPTASSYFGDYVLGVTSDGRSVALYVKQSVAGQGSSLPTGRYSLRGFASGGLLTEPVAGIGLLSGRSYLFGENGPELWRPLGSEAVRGPGECDGQTTITVQAGAFAINAADLHKVGDLVDMVEALPQQVRAWTGAR